MVTLTEAELGWAYYIIGREAKYWDAIAKHGDNAAEQAIADLWAETLFGLAAKLLAASDTKRIAIK